MNANKQDAGGLLPCPFCGAEPKLVKCVGYDQGQSSISCVNCDVYMMDIHSHVIETWNRRELCRAAPAGGAPESLVKWERDYDDTHLAPYCREDVKRLLADWRASIAAPAGGDVPDVLHPQYRHGFEAGMIFEGEHGLMTTNAPKRESAPAGSGEVDGWLLDGCLIYRLSDGRNQTNTHEINVTMWDGSRELAVRDKAAAALLRKLQQGAGEGREG